MQETTKNPRSNSPVEKSIGKALRKARHACGLSQMALAEKIGLTFQQLQKYECGHNRVSVSRLIAICKSCKITVFQYFKLLLATGGDEEGKSITALNEEVDPFEYENTDNKEVLTLIKAFTSIKDQATRSKITSLVKVLSKKLNEDAETVED